MRRNTKRADDFDADNSHRHSEVREVIKTIIDAGTDTSRLLELYYWTREPGIIELIRAYLDLPERTQRTLSTYLLNGRPKATVATFDPQGRLVLARSSAPDMSRPSTKPATAAASVAGYGGSTRRA
ncbi:MAG: hypothetical protein JSR61_07730 [Proteobacteria bacterium]|nr:hypothetical protein [Pseudomonadota bacterium]